jgi:poly(A) polymerase
VPAEPGQADRVADRLKLSNAQRLRLDGLLAPAPFEWAAIADAAAFAMALYRHGAERCRDQVMLLALDDPARDALAAQRLAAAATWQRPVFPVRGADLLALGFTPSPTISGILKELEAWWVADGFRANRETCLQRLQMQDAAEADEASGRTPRVQPK